MTEPVSHWENYGGLRRTYACAESPEFCRNCGRELITHTEPGTERSRKTGGPTYQRLHSCPAWLTGWRTSWWARWWASPGMGHDSHDAENALSSRGYI